MSLEDELQEARDNFFIGNFERAIELCQAAAAMDDMTANEANAMVGRAYLSLSNMEKIKTMQNAECPGQRAAALFAVLTRSRNEQQKEQAKERLIALAKETGDMHCAAMTASIYAGDGLWNDAVQTASSHPTLEMQALKVFFLLMCNQVDMAEKRLREAAGSNDDSGAYRLAQAAVHLATGNAEEAYLTYCDLATQFPKQQGEEVGSLLLQTGKGVSNMQRGMWTEAVEDLTSVLDQDRPDANVLVNLCTCATHLGNREDFEKHLARLTQIAPTHPFVVKTQSISTAFQRFAASQ
jgi:tetratricopeptide (TPR) repeat protein